MTVKEFVEQKCYGLEEFDEGGYLGINENRLAEILEEYHQMKLKLLQHGVSGKRPTTQGIRAMGTKYSKNNPKHNDIIMPMDLRDAFISGAEWSKSYQAACASGAVDTVAEGEEFHLAYCNRCIQMTNHKKGKCCKCDVRKSSDGQP